MEEEELAILAGLDVLAGFTGTGAVFSSNKRHLLTGSKKKSRQSGVPTPSTLQSFEKKGFERKRGSQ